MDAPESTGIISQVLGEANFVLFDDNYCVSLTNLFEPLGEVSGEVSTCQEPSQWAESGTRRPAENMEGQMGQDYKSATSTDGPTNSDIVAMLGRIDLKLGDMDKRLKKLDGLEKKVESFDTDLKKLWLHIDSIAKEQGARLIRVEDKVDSAEVDIEGARRRISDLERDNSRLKDDMNYLRSQSMRKNLIFGNIPEEKNETPARTEQIVRDFIVEKLKVAQETVNGLKLERVHRMGPKATNVTGSAAGRDGRRESSQGASGGAGGARDRSIVCKFSFFNDREMVRGQSRNLKGSKFFVSEQFPPDIAAKRRRLFRRAKEEKEAGRKAWVSYDTLYVDGRPVRDA